MVDKALLLKIADKIENEPNAYDQTTWVGFGVTGGRRTSTAWILKGMYSAEAAEAMCGTTACIAGHILLSHQSYEPFVEERSSGFFNQIINLNNNREMVEDHRKEAMKLSGLTLKEARWLFAGDWKPTGYTPDMEQREVAALVAADLRRIANGASALSCGIREDFTR